MSTALDLWDYRRRVADIYTRVRDSDPGEETWQKWRAARDRLFTTHPQTPLEIPGDFTTLPYFPYRPEWRVIGYFTAAEGETREMTHSGSGTTPLQVVGQVRFSVLGDVGSLDVFWLESYGGGVFLPFKDATNGHTTYGGGRYLLDTAKGADLGHLGDEVTLDFNYAYHPSCVHSDRWSCPLAPPRNTLTFPVEAGERLTPAS